MSADSLHALVPLRVCPLGCGPESVVTGAPGETVCKRAKQTRHGNEIHVHPAIERKFMSGPSPVTAPGDDE